MVEDEDNPDITTTPSQFDEGDDKEEKEADSKSAPAAVTKDPRSEEGSQDE